MRPIAAPATGALIGTPASMSASVEPQVEAIEVEPLELTTSRHDADHVRELVDAREDRQQRALGERAVADLAPAGAAHELRLADRVGRHVVVVHVALLGLRGDRVHALHVARRAERRDRERLRLAALEEPGAVGARQDADLDADRANRPRVAAVDADVLAQHELADGRLGHGVHERRADAVAAPDVLEPVALLGAVVALAGAAHLVGDLVAQRLEALGEAAR